MNGADSIAHMVNTRVSLQGGTPIHEQQQAGDQKVILAALDQLDVGKYQPRESMDHGKLDALAKNILSKGRRQPDTPIKIRAKADGRYEILFGHRRVEAMRLNRKRAPEDEKHLWDRIEAIEVVCDDKTAALMALTENLHREDLCPVEEGRGYLRLLEEFKCGTVKEVAKLLNLPSRRVHAMASLAKSPTFLQDAITAGIEVARKDSDGEATEPERRRLGGSDALDFLRCYRALLEQEMKKRQQPEKAEKKATERVQSAIARALTEGWSSRKVEEHCSAMMNGRSPAPDEATTAASEPAAITATKTRLTIALDKVALLDEVAFEAVRERVMASMAAARATQSAQ